MTTYAIGSEDISVSAISASLQTAAIGGGGAVGVSIDANAGHFRAGYSRYAVNVTWSNTANLCWAAILGLGNLTSFWWTARVWSSATTGVAGVGTPQAWVFRDANSVARLRMRNTLSGPFTASGPFAIEKVSAAGAVTQLGLNTTGGFSQAPAGGADKLDVFLNYGTSGQITIYVNGVQIFNYTGDVTTDGNTTIDQILMGMAAQCNQGQGTANNVCAWSELLVSSDDTRQIAGVVSQVATANGNTHNFTTAAATNVNPNLATYTSLDVSAAAGQIDEYQVTPSMPAGSFSVLEVVQHAKLAVGAGGPQHAQMMVRTGGTDYVGGTLSPTGAFMLFAQSWTTNPNTGAAWATGDLVGTSVNFNLGLKSLA